MSIYESRIEITREDGTKLPGVRLFPDDEPAVRCRGAGVVVMAGEHGLGEPELGRLARPLCEAGYVVVAFAAASWAPAADEAEAARRAQGVDRAAVVDELVGAILTLKQTATGKVGVVGVGVAAAIAVEAATQIPLIDAVVHVDGPSPAAGPRFTRLRAGVQLHRAALGTQLSSEACATITAAARRANAFVWVEDYPTHDGFVLRSTDDDEAFHGRLAWDRMRDFLAQQLT